MDCNSPGQNTGVGSLSLLQEIFPMQGANPGLPHCRRILSQLSHQGSPEYCLRSSNSTEVWRRGGSLWLRATGSASRVCWFPGVRLAFGSAEVTASSLIPSGPQDFFIPHGGGFPMCACVENRRGFCSTCSRMAGWSWGCCKPHRFAMSTQDSVQGRKRRCLTLWEWGAKPEGQRHDWSPWIGGWAERSGFPILAGRRFPQLLPCRPALRWLPGACVHYSACPVWVTGMLAFLSVDSEAGRGVPKPAGWWAQDCHVIVALRLQCNSCLGNEAEKWFLPWEHCSLLFSSRAYRVIPRSAHGSPRQ